MKSVFSVVGALLALLCVSQFTKSGMEPVKR
jgi:hypothetical protein